MISEHLLYMEKLTNEGTIYSAQIRGKIRILYFMFRVA